MSLAETFAKRYAGLRSAYGTFTSTNETREDGKASGKSQKMTIAEMYGVDPEVGDFQRGIGNVIELPNGVQIKIDEDGSWKQELLNVLEESFTKVGFTQANKPTKKTDWNKYKTN